MNEKNNHNSNAKTKQEHELETAFVKSTDALKQLKNALGLPDENEISKLVASNEEIIKNF